MDKNKINNRRKMLEMLEKRASLIFHDTHRVCGIYAIFNHENGKVYIGQTSQKIYKYIQSERKGKLRSGEMHNARLQRDFNKYGEDKFSFYIIEKFLILDDEKDKIQQTLNFLEVFYIEGFKSTNSRFGYNVEKGWDNEHTMEEIWKQVNECQAKFNSFSLGDFSDENKLPFSIPSYYLQDNTKFPQAQPGVASCIDQYIKKNHEIFNFDEYVKEFLNIYTNRSGREYINDYLDKIPFLLAKQILKKFPNTPIS